MAATRLSADKNSSSHLRDIPADIPTMLTPYDLVESTTDGYMKHPSGLYDSFTPSYVGKMDEVALDGDTDIATVSLASSDVGLYAPVPTIAFKSEGYKFASSVYGRLFPSFYSPKEKNIAKGASPPYTETSTVSLTEEEEIYLEEQRNFAKDQYFKTKMCPFHMRRECLRGDTCSFAHSRIELRTSNDLKNTRLCQNWQKNQCTRPNCPYAHGFEELRHTGDYYKTSMCIFWLNGDCPLKELCRHAHGSEELRGRTYRWTERQKGRMQKRKQFLVRRRGIDISEGWIASSPSEQEELPSRNGLEGGDPPPSRVASCTASYRRENSMLSPQTSASLFKSAFSSTAPTSPFSFASSSTPPLSKSFSSSLSFGTPPEQSTAQTVSPSHPLPSSPSPSYTFPYAKFQWPPTLSSGEISTLKTFLTATHKEEPTEPPAVSPGPSSSLAAPPSLPSSLSPPTTLLSPEMLLYLSSQSHTKGEASLKSRDISSYPPSCLPDDLLEDITSWEDSFLHRPPLMEEALRSLEYGESEGEYGKSDVSGRVFSPSLSVTALSPPYPLCVHSHALLPSSPPLSYPTLLSSPVDTTLLSPHREKESILRNETPFTLPSHGLAAKENCLLVSSNSSEILPGDSELTVVGNKEAEKALSFPFPLPPLFLKPFGDIFSSSNAVSGIIQSMVESVIHEEKAAALSSPSAPDLNSSSTTCCSMIPPTVTSSESLTKNVYTHDTSFSSYSEDATSFAKEYPSYAQRKGMEVV
ncbi:hypothetical protein IE077_003252 [Cardiosporidium cionae]|uniref:C3H1-type domain-containing protein n=1 Tax=Cardiosporidium cionae TaxID=476202 RepID=A0ABQ7J8P9_9APIC|nr:hypothetical protein IE077_003252 [Cardiosporidium cionae]|eukprot:KAF8820370.1 hypothetical protein IE077_003252 [Cardiosporidium cionae]